MVVCGSCGGGGTKTELKQYHVDHVAVGSAGVGSAGVNNNYRTYESRWVTVTCGTCGGHGSHRCPHCGGGGVVACSNCRGTGCHTFCRSISHSFTVSYTLEDGNEPGRLRRWLKQQLSSEWLIAKARTFRVESPTSFRYSVYVPHGKCVYRIAGVEQAVVIEIAGDRILQNSDFLERDLPAFDEVEVDDKESSKALANLKSALEHPVVRKVATEALVAPHCDASKVTAKYFPIGMSDLRVSSLAKAIVAHVHAAIDWKKLRKRALQWSCVTGLFYALYFVLPVRDLLASALHTVLVHGVDLVVLVCGYVPFRYLMVHLIRREYHATLDPILPHGIPTKAKFNGFACSSGRLRLWGGNMLAVPWFVIAAFVGGLVGRNSPFWIAWLLPG